MKRLVWLAVLSLVVAGASTAVATATTYKLPKAGTAAQVTKLVKASVSIKKLPVSLNPALTVASSDTVSNTYLHASVAGCGLITTSCVFGLKTSKKLVVLFGDSHAWMWLPAVDPELVKLGYRLDLLWMPGCVPADLSLYNVIVANQYDTACNTWRTTTIATIKALKPSLVLLAERTTNLMTGPSVPVTDQALATGLETTIAELQAPKTKVAIIGDDPAFAHDLNPLQCLALNPAAVQKCSTQLVNTAPGWSDLAAGELTASKASGAAFIATEPWLCSVGSCSSVIGTMPVYFDWSHLTATYSAYLSGVMGTAIKAKL